MKGMTIVGKNIPKPQAIENPNASSNHFVVLSTPEATTLEEGELPQLEGQVDVPELNIGPMEQAGVSNLELPREGEPLQQYHVSPNGAKASPSYLDITRKKQADILGSFDEDSIEKLYKKAGKKSRKEAQEEEVERLNMQGNQSTIKKSLGRSKRTRPPKGVITPSHLGK